MSAGVPFLWWGLRAQITLRVALLVLAVTAGIGLLLVMSETVNQHALLVKDGELLAQTLSGVAARYPNGRAQAGLAELFGRASARFEVQDLAVVDRTGRIIAAHDVRRVGEQLDPRNLSLHRATTGPAESIQRLLEPVSVEVSAPIMDGDQARGFVFFRFRSAEIVERAGAAVQSILIVLGFFLVIFVGLAAVFVSRITQPLTALAAAAEGLGEGALVEVDEGRRDEVSLLAQRLNAMSRGLGARAEENARLMEDLRRLNRDLEGRVAAATGDLRSARDALSATLASVEEGILTLDRAGRVLSANRAAEKLFGLRAAGILGHRLVDELASKEEAAALDGALGRALRGEAAIGLEVGGPAGPGGEARALEVDLAPIRSTGGATLVTGDKEIAAVATIRDRTQRKKIESAMRVTDKIHSLQTVSASLTHELGNYANVIRGYCTVLLRDLEPESAARGDIDAIRRVNEQAIRLIERFALFARPRAPRFDLCAPAALVEDAAVLLEPKLRERGIRLERDIAADLPAVRADRSLLVQAFFNVLLNAVQAMTRPGRIQARGRLEEGRVILEIEDDGPGIPPEVLPRVFDPFFTTKPEGEGTGLGLAIVYGIVALHKGRVEVRSEKGHGTTIRFELPAAEEPSSQGPGGQP